MGRQLNRSILVMCADRRHPLLSRLDEAQGGVMLVDQGLESALQGLRSEGREPAAMLVISNGTCTDLHVCLHKIRGHPVGRLLPITILDTSASIHPVSYPDLHINSQILLHLDDGMIGDTIRTIARYWLHLNETPVWESTHA